MGNKPSSTSSGPKPSKKKIRKFIERVSQRRSPNTEAERNKAKLASMRLNGLKPKREFYLAERVLTDTEISHIMETWPHLRSHIDQICTESFLAMFEDNPDVKDKFYEFRDYTVEDLKKPEHQMDGGTLKRHIVRVSRALAKVASNVHDLESVMDYLQVLGKLHHQHGIQNHEMLIIGPYFVACSIGYLPSVLRERPIQESWLRLFSVIMDLMRRGYPDVELTLLSDEKIAIKTTWQAVQKEVEQVGVKTFLKLFQTYSNSKVFFPAFKETPLENLTLNEALQNHGMKLVKVIEEVLNNLEDVERMTIYLGEMGREHQRMGVHKQYLDVMGPIFCQALRPILQAEGLWDNDVRTAWLRFFRIISHRMKQGYIEGPEKEQAGGCCSGTAKGCSPPKSKGRQSVAVTFKSSPTRDRAHLNLPNLETICLDGNAPPVQSQRFSVSPTPDNCNDQNGKPPLNSSLTAILRETQGEERRQQKQQNKGRRVSVGGEIQSRNNGHVHTPASREVPGIDIASRRRFSTCLSVVTDIHDYRPVSAGKRDGCHRLGVPGVSARKASSDQMIRRQSGEANSLCPQTSEHLRRASDHELRLLTTGLLSSNAYNKKRNSDSSRPRSQSCDGSARLKIKIPSK